MLEMSPPIPIIGMPSSNAMPSGENLGTILGTKDLEIV